MCLRIVLISKYFHQKEENMKKLYEDGDHYFDHNRYYKRHSVVR